MIRSLFALAPLLFACALQANFSLPQILSDGMVLQQGKPVGIWGKGEEGAQVKAWLNGQDGKTKVKNGEWSITFDPYEAGGPFELTIQSGEKTRIIKDILIGEVWIAGGRSDMQWSSNGSIDRKQELPLKANGRIRVFKQTRRSTATPQFDTLPAKWTSSTSENPKHWNAVAHWFAADLQRRLGGSRRSAHQLRRRDPANALDFIENFSGGQGFRFFPPKRSIGQAHFRITQNPLRTGTGQLHGQKKKRRKHRTGSHLLRTRSEWILQRHDPSHKKIFNPGSHLVPRRRECPYHKGCLRIPHVLPPHDRKLAESIRGSNLPFLFVQLPKASESNPGTCPLSGNPSCIPPRRLPTPGMVVAVGVGKEVGRHPHLKKPIGLRLAKLARGQVYGEKIPIIGPRFKEFSVEKAELTIRFDHLPSGLKTEDGKAPTEFTLCGPDKKFHPALARIKENSIVLSSKEVTEPVAARYCWRNECFPNLFSKNGLPVEPFRTDTFELPEKNQK